MSDSGHPQRRRYLKYCCLGSNCPSVIARTIMASPSRLFVLAIVQLKSAYVRRARLIKGTITERSGLSCHPLRVL